MARRKFVRSLCAVSLLAVAIAGSVVAASAPAGADLPPVVVKVHADRFEGPGGDGRVYARPHQMIVFELVDPADTRHTVTIERMDCEGRSPWVCEQRFDNPRDDTVDFRFSDEREYRFYDRYAREDDRQMTGMFIISAAPPPIPPSSTTTTTTAPPNTPATTAPTTTTTTAPATTTTAPGSIRPLLITDPPPTSTTTSVPLASPQTGEAPTPPADKGKEKAKGKGKSKAAATETPTTAAPADANAVPPESLFDPALLTPGPNALPDPSPGYSSGDEAALDAAALADLLDPAGHESDDGGGPLTMYALGALALVLLGGAVWGWQHRSSRYFPA